jgi:hypothetical protein
MNQMGTSNLADIENWTRRFLRMWFRRRLSWAI